jgi:hypothetical protein
MNRESSLGHFCLQCGHLEDQGDEMIILYLILTVGFIYVAGRRLHMKQWGRNLCPKMKNASKGDKSDTYPLFFLKLKFQIGDVIEPIFFYNYRT